MLSRGSAAFSERWVVSDLPAANMSVATSLEHVHEQALSRTGSDRRVGICYDTRMLRHEFDDAPGDTPHVEAPERVKRAWQVLQENDIAKRYRPSLPLRSASPQLLCPVSCMPPSSSSFAGGSLTWLRCCFVAATAAADQDLLRCHHREHVDTIRNSAKLKRKKTRSKAALPSAFGQS